MATGDYFGDLREVDHMLEAGPALEVLRAAATTLAEHLPPELAGEVAGLLPDELRDAARGVDPVRPGHLGEFVDRFRERAELDRNDILHETAIAVGILAEMLPPYAVDAVREALPDEYGALWGPGPTEGRTITRVSAHPFPARHGPRGPREARESVPR